MSKKESLWEKTKSFVRARVAGFKAFARQGAKDLHNAIVPALPDSQRGIDEPGTNLNPTPQIVTAELRGESKDYVTMKERIAALAPKRSTEKEQEMER